MTEQKVEWNNDVRLILADVDQTVADDFVPAAPGMVAELDGLLTEGVSVIFVTGGPLKRLRPRLLDGLSPENRQRVLVSHCSGAEVWGFDANGELHDEPFYSVYDQHLDGGQKERWRSIVDELVEAFALKKHPVTPIEEFHAKAGDDPLSVIYEDRGPQITLEVINGHDLTPEQQSAVRRRLPHLNEVIDLREPMLPWLAERFEQQNVPITPRLAGVFALDMAIKGVSKTESVKRILSSPELLAHIGQSSIDLNNPKLFEIWGDRFDQTRGTDWLISAAVDPAVRSVDFRREDPAHFPKGYNIVLWHGPNHLQDGALDYLRSRSGR